MTKKTWLKILGVAGVLVCIGLTLGMYLTSIGDGLRGLGVSGADGGYELSWTSKTEGGREYEESVRIWKPVYATKTMDFPSDRGGVSRVIEYSGEDRWVIPFEYSSKLKTPGHVDVKEDVLFGAARTGSMSRSDWDSALTNHTNMINEYRMAPTRIGVGEDLYFQTTVWNVKGETIEAEPGTVFDGFVTASASETKYAKGYITLVGEAQTGDEMKPMIEGTYAYSEESGHTYYSEDGDFITAYVIYAGIGNDILVTDDGEEETLLKDEEWLSRHVPIVSIGMNGQGEVILKDGIGTMFAKGFK